MFCTTSIQDTKIDNNYFIKALIQVYTYIYIDSPLFSMMTGLDASVSWKKGRKEDLVLADSTVWG